MPSAGSRQSADTVEFGVHTEPLTGQVEAKEVRYRFLIFDGENQPTVGHVGVRRTQFRGVAGYEKVPRRFENSEDARIATDGLLIRGFRNLAVLPETTDRMTFPTIAPRTTRPTLIQNKGQLPRMIAGCRGGGRR